MPGSDSAKEEARQRLCDLFAQRRRDLAKEMSDIASKTHKANLKDWTEARQRFPDLRPPESDDSEPCSLFPAMSVYNKNFYIYAGPKRVNDPKAFQVASGNSFEETEVGHGH